MVAKPPTLAGLPLADLFKANKYVFVAYTGLSTRLNTTCWYAVTSKQWALLRHNLEAFGAEACEREALGRGWNSLNGRPTPNTYIRGFVAYRVMRDLRTKEDWPQQLKDLFTPKTVSTMALPETELKGSDWALPNMFIFIVRASLPAGARPYVPLEERTKWALMAERAQYDTANEDLKAQMKHMKDLAEDHWHAADRETRTVTVEGPRGPPVALLGPNTGDPWTEHPGGNAHCEYVYSMPPLDYLCPSCREFGRHYQEACWMFEAQRAAAAPEQRPKALLQFGAKKFGTAKTATSEDAMFYALMHKRQTKK